MRNSLFPAVLLTVTVGVALWLIRPQEWTERGAGGPEVFPGIVKLPTRESRMTPSAALDDTTTHHGSAPADAAAWRVILVAGADDTKLTKAAVLALGEELTKRGCLAILAPKQRDPQEPLPLGCDGTLRVAAIDQTLGKRPGELTASWTIEALPTRVPSACPAARWLPAQTDSSPTTLTIVHHSTPLNAPTWPTWFAAIGRAVATETLSALGLPLADLDVETTAAIHRASWIMPGEVDADGHPLNRFERIPSPPQADILERTVCFQQPFVRGWIGHLSPVPVKTRAGVITTSREELLRRLKRTWQPGPVNASDNDTVSFAIDDTQADGTVIHRTLTLTGDLVVEWQERPQPLAVWQAWKTAAAAGNQQAAELLRMHRATIGLPDDLRR